MSEASPELIDLSEDWALWPDLVLRSSGFSVRGLEALIAPEIAARLRELENWERETAETLRTYLDEAKQAKRGIKKQQSVERLIDEGEILSALERVARHGDLERAEQMRAAGQTLTEALDETLESAPEMINSQLTAELEEPRLREAVTWQNRRALVSIRRNLSSRKGVRRREAESAVAAYLQRYLVKNDTAGFYGPRVWGRVHDGRTEVVVPDGDLVTHDVLIVEFWAVAEICKRIEQLADAKNAFPPRLHPAMSLDGDQLTTMFGTVPLEGSKAKILGALDGARSADEIADDLVAAGHVPAAANVFEELTRCADQGFVIWSVEVPNERAPFEPRLRERVLQIRNRDSRERALSLLDELERARVAALQARGDADRVATALAELDELFHEITGTDATRKGGQMYAGRTVVHLECRRNLELRIGREVIEAMRPATLVFDSARWLSHRIARAYRRDFEAIHGRIAEQTGRPEVPLTRFYAEALPLFSLGRPERDLPEAMRDALGELRKRWGEVLSLDPGQTRRELSYEELAPRVAEAFASPEAGWPSAQTHSPDFMIAADSPKAITEGRFLLVLGELHPFVISVENEVLTDAHPEPQRLRALLDEAYPNGRVVFCVPPGVPSRHMSRPAPGGSRDIHLAVPGTTPSAGLSTTTLAASELCVRATDRGLIVGTYDGSRTWNGFDFLNNTIVPPFDVVPADLDHTPRVTVDKLVLSREKWRFGVDALGFAATKDNVRRWRQTRRWAIARGLPRRCFYRVASETKPMYLDFDAPRLVDLFTRHLRAQPEGANLSVSEMLPAPEECWLPDRDGERYTSELRFVVRERGTGTS